MSNNFSGGKVWAWKVNLLVMTCLAGGVLAYSLMQVYQLRSTLAIHLVENCDMVVRTVNRQVEQGLAAEDALNETIELFLANTARFIHNLHKIEPFSGIELANYADENSLTGILLHAADGSQVQGPAGWYSGEVLAASKTLLLQNKNNEEVIFSWPTPRGGTVLLGLPDRQLTKLHQQFGVDVILAHLSDSPEINFIEIKNQQTDYSQIRPGINLETVVVAGHEVIVGFDTTRYEQRVAKVWQDFFLYGSLLGGFGLFLSWLLYAYQQHYFNEIQSFERALAREQEDAVLGRAAGTIAHEVRNPLNAIGIGLQRIGIEANLEKEHEQLVAAMGEALRRTNTIVEGLLSYSKPLTIKTELCNMDKLLAQVVLLRELQCRSEAIDLTFSPGCTREVLLDKNGFSQVIDNVLKNSIEAQPTGGWIIIESGVLERQVWVRVKNAGFTKGAEIDQLVEPYFTGKTRGSGLGLAICEKVIQAHGGELLFKEPESGVLQVDILFPIADLM